jgi:capsular polysaccharide biosynthesis protein
MVVSVQNIRYFTTLRRLALSVSGKNMTNDSPEFTVTDIVRTLRRQYKVVIGVPLIVTVAAVVFALTLKNTYRAEGTLEVGRVMEYPLEPPPTVVDRLASKPFLARVGRKLGMEESPAQLQNMVHVESIFAESRDRPLTRGIKILVQSDNAEKSAKFAEGILDAAIAEHEAAYKGSMAVSGDYLKDLEERIARMRAQIDGGHEEISRLMAAGLVDQVELSYLASYVEEKESYILHLEEVAYELRQKLYMDIYTNPTRITVEPVLPGAPAGPNRRRIILLAFAISFVLGVIIAFFFDRLSDEGRETRVPAENEKKKWPPPVEPAPAPTPPTPERAGPEPPRIQPPEVNRLPENRNLTLSDYWRILKSQARLVGVTLVLGLILGLIYGLAKPRVYETDFVISTGIVGDHWLHSPMVTEEQCTSHWFLNELSTRLNKKYDVFELQDMIEAELVMTPTKGLTRELRITVKAEKPDDCYGLANNLGGLLEEADREVYEKTHKMYESYLADLEKVLDGLTAAPGGPETSALAPGLAVFPPDEETEYPGGAQAYSLFKRSIPYEENPYAISSLALFQQVYIDTYIKTRSPIFSQPTAVIVPPLRPTQPEGPGPVSIVLTVLFVSLVLGITLAAVNYRLQQARARP